MKKVKVGEERFCDNCNLPYIPKRYNQYFCKRIHIAHCCICNKEINLNKEKKYLGCEFYTCSKNCSNEKAKKTNLKKYGAISPSMNPLIRKKIEETNLKKYGATYNSQTEEYREKIKKTNLKKYGVEYYFQTKEFKEKSEKTNLDRYGNRYFLSTKKAHEKIKGTVQKKYGVDNVFQAKEIKEKIKKTNLKKYGFPSATKNENVKEKIKKTNLRKYGVENPLSNKKIRENCLNTLRKKYKNNSIVNISQVPEIKEKIRRTVEKEYGENHISKVKEIRLKANKTVLSRYGTNFYSQKHIKNYNDWINLEEYLLKNKNKYTIVDLMEYFNVSNTTLRQIIIKLKMQDYVNNFYSLSINEDIFIKTLEKELNLKRNIDIELHNRTIIYPYEIDIFFPKYNIGIEISPTWTHQYNGLTETHFGKDDKIYHYSKFKKCKEKGIELLTIFDWTDIDKIIKFLRSKIDNKLITVPARKTKVNIVDSLTKEHKEFLEKNHILGKINNSSTTKVIELLYQDKVLGIGVFEKKTNYFELRRLAFESNYRVVGGASKIISNYRKIYSELKELITFSDNDLGTGNVYKSLGFKVLTENKGTLIWYNSKYDKKIPNLSLVKQGTDRLLKNFPDYKYVGQGEDLPSNQEIIRSYGFLPIYDCGYTKWSLEFK